jgi:hypothetical protein
VSISGSNNGTGFTETKATIRGFQDGDYNVTYDSIPFADTNNPTHHSTAFFPTTTIETVVVDRGPGNASQLGQATYGGNINMYSRAASDQMGGHAGPARQLEYLHRPRRIPERPDRQAGRRQVRAGRAVPALRRRADQFAGQFQEPVCQGGDPARHGQHLDSAEHLEPQFLLPVRPAKGRNLRHGWHRCLPARN